ncbi:VOC family protein [Streptacidiphilus sp. PAMC 29251]
MTDQQRGQAFIHHVELWMDDLATAERQWSPVLLALGCELYQSWANGRSWRRDGSYVVIEQSPALRDGGHDRLRAGINHLRGARPARAGADGGARGRLGRADGHRAGAASDGQSGL